MKYFCILFVFASLCAQTQVHFTTSTEIHVDEGEALPHYAYAAPGHSVSSLILDPTAGLYHHYYTLSANQSWIDLSLNDPFLLSPSTVGPQVYPVIPVLMRIDTSQLRVPAGQTIAHFWGEVGAAQGTPHMVYVHVRKPANTQPELSVTPNFVRAITPQPYFNRSFTIQNSGGGNLAFNLTSNSYYVSIYPSSGNLGAGQSTTISVYGSNYPRGTNSSSIQVLSNAGNQTVNVQWTYILFKSGGPELNDEPWPDPVLEDYIKTHFDSDGDGFLSNQELRSVKEIYLVDSGLSDLSGIQLFPNLMYLNVSGNDLREAKGLEGLEYLFMVNLSHNPMDALPKLPASLKHLSFEQD